MRHGNFAVLVAALFFIGNLVFDLNAAGAGFNHFFRQQICGFRIAETGVDVGDNRYDMGFKTVDFGKNILLSGFVAGRTGFIKRAKQQIQFAGIRLAQEAVDFLNQPRHRGFLVHGLVGQRAELRTHRRHHPT